MAYDRNEFGKFAAGYRVTHNLMLVEFAQRLGVGSSFLSNVEHGRKAIPEGWEVAISREFGLNIAEQGQLRVAIMRSKRTFTFTASNDAELRVLVAFDENRDRIDKETSMRVVRAVRKEEGDGNGGITPT